MKLFVYGTLKKGFSRHAVLEGAKYLGDYTIYNAKMYSVHGDYPIVMPSFHTDDIVKGELYEVTEEILKLCDKVETGFNRHTVTVVKANDKASTEAIIYIGSIGLAQVLKKDGVYTWNDKRNDCETINTKLKLTQ